MYRMCNGTALIWQISIWDSGTQSLFLYSLYCIAIFGDLDGNLCCFFPVCPDSIHFCSAFYKSLYILSASKAGEKWAIDMNAWQKGEIGIVSTEFMVILCTQTEW